MLSWPKERLRIKKICKRFSPHTEPKVLSNSLMLGKQKRNILFVVNNLNIGGAQKHVVTLINGLGERGFNLFLVSLKDPDIIAQDIDRKSVQDVVYFRIKGKFSFPSVKRLARYIESNDIDLVVCANRYAMMYGIFAGLVSGKKVDIYEIFHTTLIHGLKNNLLLLLHRWFFNQCNMVVFVSENQRLHWLHNRKLRVRRSCTIYNGVDTDCFKDDKSLLDHNGLLDEVKFSESDYIVGICAVLRPEKYHIDLINAIAIARDKKCDVKLLILGDGPMRASIEHHIAAKHLGEVTYITGFKNDVRPYISLCSCMVICSHYVETFSIAALESMAMGMPMIMTNIGGATEQIKHGHNGFIYPTGDLARLADHIIELSDPGLCKKMGGHARQTVIDQFTLQGMVQGYEEMFLQS